MSERERPYGWIQWKGTDVCMDLNCSCGALCHVDGEFAYAVECSECGKVFECVPFIELKEVARNEMANPLLAE